MENLIGDILDHRDGVTPILGVGLAPFAVSDEDRDGYEEADDGDDKEYDGDIHDRSPFLQTQTQCGHMSHSDN